MHFHLPVNNAMFNKAESTYDLVNKFLTVYRINTIVTLKILSITAKNYVRLYEVNSTLIARFSVDNFRYPPYSVEFTYNLIYGISVSHRILQPWIHTCIKDPYATPISNSNPDLQPDRGWGWKCAHTRSNRFVQSLSVQLRVCVMNKDK